MKVEVRTLTESIVNDPYFRSYKERTDLIGKNEVNIGEYISYYYNEFHPDSDDVFCLPEQVEEKDVHVIRTTLCDIKEILIKRIYTIHIPNNIIFCHGAWQTDAINLERFEVEEGNQAYCEKDGILYSKDMKILYKCPCRLKDKEGLIVNKVCVPDGVEYIYPQAFDDCTEIEEIDLPSSLVYIGTQAFMGCRSLKSITIPDSVRDIDGYLYSDKWETETTTFLHLGVFLGCQNLRFVDYGMLTTLPESIFAGCWSLESFIGKNVSHVDSSAFNCCIKLKKVDVPTEEILSTIIKSSLELW